VITLVQLAFKPMLRLLPFLLQMLISTGVVAFVLTLLVMPGMNRLFGRWLHTPPAGRAPGTMVH
jgi:antibiotic biosynthesis monooxygenase (ABM) superfamily enzyme